MRDSRGVRGNSKHKVVDLSQLSLEPLWVDVTAVGSDYFGILAGSRSLSFSPERLCVHPLTLTLQGLISR